VNIEKKVARVIVWLMACIVGVVTIPGGLIAGLIASVSLEHKHGIWHDDAGRMHPPGSDYPFAVPLFFLVCIVVIYLGVRFSHLLFHLAKKLGDKQQQNK